MQSVKIQFGHSLVSCLGHCAEYLRAHMRPLLPGLIMKIGLLFVKAGSTPAP
jgi:hypothetical protein